MTCPNVTPAKIEELNIGFSCIHYGGSPSVSECFHYCRITLKNGLAGTGTIHQAALAQLLLAVDERRIVFARGLDHFNSMYDHDWFELPDNQMVLSLFFSKVQSLPWLP